jgi:hypothetical protein
MPKRATHEKAAAEKRFRRMVACRSGKAGPRIYYHQGIGLEGYNIA